MSILNRLACYVRSRRISNANEFYKEVNARRGEIKKIEVRGSITRGEAGILGEVQKYFHYLEYCALNQEGKPLLKLKKMVGYHDTCLGFPTEEKGLCFFDDTLDSIEKKVIALAKEHKAENLVNVMFAEQIGA